MYDYAFTLPEGFRAVAGTKYWVEIVAWQGLTPTYHWPPDWSLAYGTGGNGSHFRGIGGTGLIFQTISNDTAFSLVSHADGPGIVVTAPAPPPTVTSVAVNDGAPQRSRVTTLAVTFSEAVSFAGPAAGAFQVVRTGPGEPLGAVAVEAVPAGNTVALTFTAGGPVGLEAGSLPDGTYRLEIDAAKVIGAGGALDGDGDGTGGDGYATPATGPGCIHRLFGDADGDGDVDAVDFGAFRGAFGTGPSIFDADADGDTDAADFGGFRARFGMSV
jgi:hypothetical protein